MDKLILTNSDVWMLASNLAQNIRDEHGLRCFKLYGVPRGGISAAYMLAAHLQGSEITDNPEEADYIVDDLVDSGRTRAKFSHLPGRFAVLIDKQSDPLYKGRWIIFPWERQDDSVETSADDIVVRLLQYVGEDPEREGLKETPARVLKAWKHWTSGYGQTPESVAKVFKDGAQKYDEMLWENELPFYSMCEHHLAPFFGSCTIAYIPDGAVCGLSKFKRIVDIFSRRLQMQERLTVQIADAIEEVLKPYGCGVIMKARHMCKESRGISIQGSFTTTSALRGKFKEDPTVRAEFLSLR